VEHASVAVGGRIRVKDVSFELRAGEILGIAGLLGAGRTELLGAIYGHLPHTGQIVAQDRIIASMTDARRAGIALLTEDRKRDGLLFNLPLRSNVTIGNLAMMTRGGFVRSDVERRSVLEQMTRLSIKARSAEDSIAHLSGGNQQKVLFGRVLMRNPKVLLLDEPSKGVDVATRQEIYRLIVELADSGAGLIVVSSELEEVLGLTDRCLVMAGGRIIDEFHRGEATEERVLHAIAATREPDAQSAFHDN
jgi:ABC-type sugar transport system ATPase subunit